MNTRSQLVCAWVSMISLVPLFVSFFLVTGYVPPQRANETADQLAGFYRDHTLRIQLGLLVLLVAWAGWGALVAVLSAQLARIEGGRPVMAALQAISGAVGWIFLLLPTLLLAVASFRPERSPEITQTLHDLGWITAFMPITPFVVQVLSVAYVIFRDAGPTPVYPRWLGYFNIWVAVLFVPGGLLIFFKTGPFAYHGLFVFWIPFLIFGGWILVMSLFVRRVALEEARTAQSGAPAPLANA